MAGNVASECSETTVEIKIKMLDSQTFTLRVDKCVPVPQLKEQIASLTGVVTEQQRLICRGKVLMDDQLLSAYHVEDGHTLHLVVRQPVAPTPEIFDHPAIDPTSSDGHNPHVMVGTFNLSEQGDGAFPDLNRIVSAVLGSFRVARSGIGGEGIDLNHPPLASAAALPVDSLQLPIILDSLTTLLQYLNHLGQEFLANAGGNNANAQNAGVHSSEPRGLLRPESLAEVMLSARQLLVEQATVCLSYLPVRSKACIAVIDSTLVVGDGKQWATQRSLPALFTLTCVVNQLAGQLESHSSVLDPLERSRIQSIGMRVGALFQNLGALLLELGRATMTLRMGQTPADALVNAGPAVFVSSTGPNPIMVQPLPLQPGASFGSVPVGTVQPGSGGSAAASTTGFAPRNIDIRIRTGSSFISRREPTASSQPVAQGGAAAVDPNSQQARVAAAIAAAVPTLRPVSIGRSSESSRGSSIGILYPVLARVQHVASSPGTRASGQHNGNTGQPVAGPTDPTTQHQNNYFAVPPGGNGGNGTSLPTSEEALLNDPSGFPANMRSGLEQLLSTIYPRDVTSNSAAAATPGGSAPAVPSQTTQEAAEDIRDPASASGASDEGIMLSNILRHILPIISSQNTTTTTNEDAQTQADDGNNPDHASPSRRHEPGPQSQQPDSKRQRRG